MGNCNSTARHETGEAARPYSQRRPDRRDAEDVQFQRVALPARQSARREQRGPSANSPQATELQSVQQRRTQRRHGRSSQPHHQHPPAQEDDYHIPREHQRIYRDSAHYVVNRENLPPYTPGIYIQPRRASGSVPDDGPHERGRRRERRPLTVNTSRQDEPPQAIDHAGSSEAKIPRGRLAGPISAEADAALNLHALFETSPPVRKQISRKAQATPPVFDSVNYDSLPDVVSSNTNVLDDGTRQQESNETRSRSVSPLGSAEWNNRRNSLVSLPSPANPRHEGNAQVVTTFDTLVPG